MLDTIIKVITIIRNNYWGQSLEISGITLPRKDIQALFGVHAQVSLKNIALFPPLFRTARSFAWGIGIVPVSTSISWF